MQPHPITIIPIVGFVVGAVMILLLWPGSFEGKGSRVFGFVILALAILSVPSPLFWEYPRSGRVMVTLDQNGNAHKHPLGTWDWREHYFVPRWRSDFDPDGPSAPGSSVTPITDNPKARKISYRAVPEIADMDLFFIAKGQFENRDATSYIIRMVEYELYEFNEKHSADLARFYNPLDETQVRELAELVEGFVNPRLASVGLKITVPEFEVQ